MKKLILLMLSLLFIINAKAQDCPNGDFENWNTRNYSNPDSMWYTSNTQSLALADTLTVWPVTGFSGQAIHIQSAIIGTDSAQAYITNTASGDPMSGKGGVPYTQQPTAITGYYRYNLVSGDSALLIAIFKKSGSVIAVNMFKIRNATGSVSTFTAFSLPLSTLSVAPDSVIIAAASSNLAANVLYSGSWLELDQLEFTTSQPIPGGSFNTWVADTLNTPVNWAVQSGGPSGGGVTRSTLHHSGNYSIKLVSQASGGGGGGAVSPAGITTGSFLQHSGPTGGLPYTHMVDTLTGYYMYTPAGTDTGFVMINLSAGGSPVSSANHNFMPAASWTYFSVPFSASSTPDTIRIDVTSGSFAAGTPGSVLYLDYMQLKSQPIPVLEVKGFATSSDRIAVYPNPANDVLNIRYENATGPISVKMMDITGRVLESSGYEAVPAVITFSTGYLQPGIYLYELTNDGAVIRGKFSKE